MNKEKHFQHYRPFLEYLFGPMSDQEYGAMFWPGSSSSKHNFSRFISHGEKSAEVKRRIGALLAFEPGLLPCDIKDSELNGHQTGIEAFALMTVDRVCKYLEPTWQKLKAITVLENSLKQISKLAVSRDPRIPVLWLGVDVLLQKANEILIEHLRYLDCEFKKAFSACSYLTDTTHMDEARFMFRNRLLAIKSYAKHRNSHIGCMTNSR